VITGIYLPRCDGMAREIAFVSGSLIGSSVDRYVG
jgi:hypothetical protein